MLSKEVKFFHTLLNSPIVWNLESETCPQAYTATYVGRPVAHIRERHGHTTVCPIVNHKTDTSTYLYEKRETTISEHIIPINDAIACYILQNKTKLKIRKI